ncbi:MAG: metallophosphatase family protein [Candidatus Omnitrophica bacterium]|nr:metallophosphatase family protein [Candidatus Omnitrophota bacterium]MCM8790298.1 metallophosphatase family protein [Candidatus Omnitrophota bacterium]
MRILVLSDTHIPRVAEDLPAVIYKDIKSMDMLIHAGDFVDYDFFAKLKKLKKLYAVAGNMDCAELRRSLNSKEVISVGKFKIGLIHGYGAPRDIMETVRSEFGSVDAIVFGHSHVAVNITKEGVLFFNPGSPTDTIFTDTNSYGILEVTDKKIEGKILTL